MIFGIIFCFILTIINFVILIQTQQKIYELEEIFWEKWTNEK